jgi:hypothetical protein
MSEAQQQFDKAAELEKSSLEQALSAYNALIHKDGIGKYLDFISAAKDFIAGFDDKLKEQSIYRAGEILAKLGY